MAAIVGYLRDRSVRAKPGEKMICHSQTKEEKTLTG